MKRGQRNEQPDLSKAHKGMIPWSREEFYKVFAKYATRKQRLEKQNVKNPDLLADVFQKEYPDSLEFTAHLYRFQLLRMFIFKYGRKLIEDGFAAPNGEPGYRNELMDILCTLPYSKAEMDTDGEKSYNFVYSQVKAAALKKINAHLN